MQRTLVAILIVGLAGPALAGETELSGFADGSYFYDANADAGEFGVDQVELDVVHRAGPQTSVRADLEWVKDGADFVARIEQAYMTYAPDEDVSFTLGQFNAPIGFELLDAPDMYQYSHSLVFDYGLPTNLTGFSVGHSADSGIDVVAYICNGWDRNAEDNRNPTFGGRLGYTAECGAGVGLSAISGREDVGAAAFTRTVFDVDLAYGKDAWTFGGELNLGTVDQAGGGNADWKALLVMAHVAANDRLGFTGRFDTFDDADGFAFGTAQRRSSFTFAPTVALDDGFGALVEVRLDTSDEDVWIDRDGQPTDRSLAIAAEGTYSW